MGIFKRMNDVIRSNLNSMLDKAEDPEKLIGQTIQDMEDELKRARRELVSTLGTSKRLDKKAEEAEAEVSSWENKAVLALKAGDDALAREALKRKLKAQQSVEDVKRQAAEQATAADRMKDTLEQIERKIEDFKARKSSLAAQVRRSREAPSTEAGGSKYGSSAFDELDRMAGTIDQLDSEVEAANALDDGPNKADLDAKFRQLEKGSKGGVVEDELAALKKKLGG